MAPEISIVIPTHGTKEALARVLERLEAQGPPYRFDVVLSVDRDDPGPVRELAADRPYAAHVVGGDRGGASGARNRGWREALAPLILFMGDDILPEHGMIDRHLAQHARHPDEEVGVLGHVRWADELELSPFMRWLDESGLQFDYSRIDGEKAAWYHFYTANASVKRAMLNRTGGFDQTAFPYLYEDIELAARMSEHGFQLIYDDAAAAEHLHVTTLDSWRERVVKVARAEREFQRRYPDYPAHFHSFFSRAVQRPKARGLSGRLARFLPVDAGWVGARAKASAEETYAQDLGARFLAAWEEAGRHAHASEAGSEASQPSGAIPSGP